jgi:DNA-binding NarL/FixJ family response regulator
MILVTASKVAARRSALYVRPMQSDLPSLSLEEALILLALGGGLTNEEISSIRGLDIETVRCRSRAVISKFHGTSRAKLMRAAWDLVERAALEKAAPRAKAPRAVSGNPSGRAVKSTRR